MILTGLSNPIKKLWEKISFHKHFKFTAENFLKKLRKNPNKGQISWLYTYISIFNIHYSYSYVRIATFNKLGWCHRWIRINTWK